MSEPITAVTVKIPKRMGRPRKWEAVIRQAKALEREAWPKVIQEIIAKALGQPTPVSCPKCKHNFKASILGTGDKELLMHLDNRIQGKPIARTEELSTNQLTSGQLLRLLNDVKQAEREYIEADYSILEAEVKAIPVSNMSEDVQIHSAQSNQESVKDIENQSVLKDEQISQPGMVQTLGENLDESASKVESSDAEIARLKAELVELEAYA